MSFLRSAAAVFGGFAAMTLAVILATAIAGALPGVGSGPGARPPVPYLAANLGGSLLAAVVGGVVAASLAPRRPTVHAVALAGLVLVVGGASLLLGDLAAAGQPAWYAPVAVGIGIVGVLLGGALRGGLGGPARGGSGDAPQAR